MADVMSFRVKKEIADRFRTFCKEYGMNQELGMEHLLQVVELDKAKELIPGRRTEIEEFEVFCKKILAAYMNSLDVCHNAEERIREQFAHALDSKDKTISDLQDKVTELKEDKTSAEQMAATAAQSAARAIKDESIAREQVETTTKLIAEKDRTIATLADKLAIAENKLAGYDELKAEKTDLERKIRELDAEMERKVSDAKKDAELSVARAVAEKEREMTGQIMDTYKETAKLQAKIEIMEARIRELTVVKTE